MVNSKAHFQTAWGGIIHFFHSFIHEVLAEGLVCGKERKEKSKSHLKPSVDSHWIFEELKLWVKMFMVEWHNNK